MGIDVHPLPLLAHKVFTIMFLSSPKLWDRPDITGMMTKTLSRKNNNIDSVSRLYETRIKSDRRVLMFG